MRRDALHLLGLNLLGLTILVGVVLLGLMTESLQSPLGFGGAGTDIRSLLAPHWHFVAKALRAGRLPLWNPHIFTGQPELAGAQWGVLYPIQAALLLSLPVRAAILASIWLHLCLTFVAGYLLSAAWLQSHHRPVDVAARCLGGLALLGSGVVMGHLYAGHVMLTQATPWFVLGAAAGLHALAGGRFGGPLTSACFAMGVLAGGIQIAPYAGLSALVVWAAAAPALRPSPRAVLTLTLWIAAAATLAAGQLLPTLELTAHSGRQLLGQIEVRPRFLLRGADLRGLFISTATDDWERASFLGAPIIALALARLIGPSRKAAVILWLGALGAWLLGSAVASDLVAELPGVQLLRVPSRSVWVVATVLPLAAVETLTLPHPDGARVMRLAAWICGVFALLSGMTGAGLLAVLLTLLAAAALAWSAFYPSDRARSWVVTATAVVLLMGAVLSFPALRAERDVPAPVRAAFVSAAPNYRVMTGPGGLWNLGMRHGYMHLGGYEPLMTARAMYMARLLSAQQPNAQQPNAQQPNAQQQQISKRMFAIVPDRPLKPHPLWRRLSVGWALGPDNAALAQWGRRVAVAGDTALFQANDPVPRASFVACPAFAPSPDAALKLLVATGADSVAAVVESTALPCAAADATATVKISRDDAEFLEIEAVTSGPGWLIIQDLLYPGWHATVDGKTTPLLPANGVGRALRLTAGSHVIQMRFSPDSVRAGLGISGVAWALWLLWMLWILRQVWRQRPRPSHVLAVTLLMMMTMMMPGCATITTQRTCGKQGVALEVLGSGGPRADDGRASSGYLIWRDGKAIALIDAGGGIFLRFGESGATFEHLEVVLLSHMHVDHTADLPALLKSAWFGKRRRPLTLIGPPAGRYWPSVAQFIHRLFADPGGLYPYLSGYLDGSDGHFKLQATVASQPRKFQLGDLRIESRPIRHGPVPALAYRITIPPTKPSLKPIIVGFTGDFSGDDPSLTRFFTHVDLLIVHHAIGTHPGPVADSLHATPQEILALTKLAKPYKVLLSHHMARSLNGMAAHVKLIKADSGHMVLVAEDHRCVEIHGRNRR